MRGHGDIKVEDLHKRYRLGVTDRTMIADELSDLVVQDPRQGRPEHAR